MKDDLKTWEAKTRSKAEEELQDLKWEQAEERRRVKVGYGISSKAEDRK